LRASLCLVAACAVLCRVVACAACVRRRSGRGGGGGRAVGRRLALRRRPVRRVRVGGARPVRFGVWGVAVRRLALARGGLFGRGHRRGCGRGGDGCADQTVSDTEA
jgi:hypothetical protein